MDARQARTEFQDGRLSIEQLLDLLDKQQRTIKRLEAEIDRLKQRLGQYEPEVLSEASPASTESTRYSVEAEEKRRRKRRRKKKSRGRRPTHLKFAEAERIENVYPPDVRHEDCRFVRERPVWRLEDGHAVLVGYRIFRGPDGDEGRIPGVTPAAVSLLLIHLKRKTA